MGAKAEGSQHRELDGLPGIPKFPKHVKVYSGDIHLPQLVLWGAPVTYVGAPHRVRYGDDHVCRMLALDSETYEIAEELVLDSPLKAVIDISSLEQFKGLGLAPGDMVRVRFTIPPNRIEQWAVDEADLREMASQAGITLASIEPIVEQHGEEDQPIEGFDKDPRSVLEAFAREEGLDQGLLNAGLALLAAP
jgi:hypothetical protein